MRLRELRKNRGLRQKDIAEKIGVSPQSYTNVHKERKEQYEVISHKNHLLYREVLTAFGDHPCCLSLLYHMRKFLSIKNFNGAASGVVFSCRSALLQTAGRGIRYLSAFPAASP